MISSIILLWGALPNLKGLVKCALWGLRGRTPLQVLYRQVGLLIKFRCGRSVTASPRTGNVLTSTFDVSFSQVIPRRARRSSSFILPHSFCLALRLLLFLGRNMIFHQNKTVEHFHIGQFVQWHIIKFFRNFTPYIEPKEPVRRLP